MLGFAEGRGLDRQRLDLGQTVTRGIVPAKGRAGIGVDNHRSAEVEWPRAAPLQRNWDPRPHARFGRRLSQLA